MYSKHNVDNSKLNYENISQYPWNNFKFVQMEFIVHIQQSPSTLSSCPTIKLKYNIIFPDIVTNCPKYNMFLCHYII